jgi:hypothetical protein
MNKPFSGNNSRRDFVKGSSKNYYYEQTIFGK